MAEPFHLTAVLIRRGHELGGLLVEPGYLENLVYLLNSTLLQVHGFLYFLTWLLMHKHFAHSPIQRSVYQRGQHHWDNLHASSTTTKI